MNQSQKKKQSDDDTIKLKHPLRDGCIVIGLAVYHYVLVIGACYVVFYTNFLATSTHSVVWEVACLGLAGGCTHCTRSLYVQYCAKEKWKNTWIVWHIIRPGVSAGMGVFSLMSVKTGLLALAMSETTLEKFYGIYALAFVVGYNVDYFQNQIKRKVAGISESDKEPESGKQDGAPRND